jgi:transposase
MPRRVKMKPLTEKEREVLNKLSRSRTAPSRMVERAKAMLQMYEGQSVQQIARSVGRTYGSVYNWIKRFNQEGISGLDDRPRSGRPLIYSEEERGQIIAVARIHPQKMGRPYAYWTLSRLVEVVNNDLNIGISQTQLARILGEEGLRWYHEGACFTERPDPRFAAERGHNQPV